jgi:hypothetical protein
LYVLAAVAILILAAIYPVHALLHAALNPVHQNPLSQDPVLHHAIPVAAQILAAAIILAAADNCKSEDVL